MNILGYTGKLISQKLLPAIPKKHHCLFTFGLSAFALNSFQSLASNARQVVENLSTASSKVYRLTKNDKLLSELESLVTQVSLVHPGSVVNVDFSSFCGFETLAFAVQTSLGRAIPIWIDCLQYPIKQVGSQNLFIIDQIKRLGVLLGFWPTLVFDRGFAIPSLIKFMLANEMVFCVRIKAGQTFRWSVSQTTHSTWSAKQIGRVTKDTVVDAYGSKLRLVVSPIPPQPPSVFKQTPKERWYILTNDFTSSRKQILKRYQCRFEIEETFKDIKHIADLKKFFLKKRRSFKILLWLVMIGFWLAWWSRSLTATIRKVHPKKLRSWFLCWWEEVQRLIRLAGNQRLQWIYSLARESG